MDFTFYYLLLITIAIRTGLSYTIHMINIRSATIDDIKILQVLNSEVFGDNFRYDIDLDLNWSLSEEGKQYYSSALSEESAVCLIAEDAGKPVGYLSGGKKEEVGRKGKYFEIYDMGVTPDYRSKGIGKMLIDRCFVEAKSKGFEKISVRVYFKNFKAIEFYRRSGLQEIEVGLEKSL